MTTPFQHVRADIPRYQRGNIPPSRAAALRKIWIQPGFQAVVVYRFGRWLVARRGHAIWLPLVWLLFPFFWLLQASVRRAYDIHLDMSADVGPGLYIGHFGGIRLESCRVGRHCSIQQQVHVHPATNVDGGPDVGDRVWIGAHTRILGPIRIGGHSTISVGSVVTSDVAPRCLVLGDPARVVRWDFDNSEFL